MFATSPNLLGRWLAGLFTAPDGLRQRPLQISRFGIGFCPDCKHLRGAASLACADCGSTAPVLEDA